MVEKESKPTSSIIRPELKINHEGEVCSITQKDGSVIEFYAKPYSKKAKKYGRSFWKQKEGIHKEKKIQNRD